MTVDLRDQLPAFEAAARRLIESVRFPRHLALVWAVPAECHRRLAVYARGLCRACYDQARGRGTLHESPMRRTQRSRADFVSDYRMLRGEGYNRHQIATRLGMNYPAVTAAYRRAVTAGDLEPDRRRTA